MSRKGKKKAAGWKRYMAHPFKLSASEKKEAKRAEGNQFRWRVSSENSNNSGEIK